jgi:hypothetical protein
MHSNHRNSIHKKVISPQERLQFREKLEVIGKMLTRLSQAHEKKPD